MFPAKLRLGVPARPVECSGQASAEDCWNSPSLILPIGLPPTMERTSMHRGSMGALIERYRSALHRCSDQGPAYPLGQLQRSRSYQLEQQAALSESRESLMREAISAAASPRVSRPSGPSCSTRASTALTSIFMLRDMMPIARNVHYRSHTGSHPLVRDGTVWAA